MINRSDLPACLLQYLDAVNTREPEAFLSIFAADAVVHDIGREIRGLEAIRHWATKEIFAVNVSLEPISFSSDAHEGIMVVTVKVDGSFDRTGLPDPLIMTHTFEILEDEILSLTCRLA